MANFEKCVSGEDLAFLRKMKIDAGIRDVVKTRKELFAPDAASTTTKLNAIHARWKTMNGMVNQWRDHYLAKSRECDEWRKVADVDRASAARMMAQRDEYEQALHACRSSLHISRCVIFALWICLFGWIGYICSR